MKFKIFQFSIPTEPDVPELNTFLASHRIAAVTQQIVPLAQGSMLVFVVEYIGNDVPGKARPNTKIDYRDELSPADFQIYSNLRELRKQLAEADGVPVYTIFTNAQLAEIARRRLKSLAALQQLDGVGAARIEKYGAKILAVMASNPIPGVELETDR